MTAQNLERRALAALGAVTVVPGAVGAWRRTALEMLGGYPGETLAEDQDLTIAVQRAGWAVAFDPSARAYTEAPDTLDGLLKQRFRWSFGTLQCIWKHRAATFDVRHPALGFVALPQIWLFQIALAIAAPLVDLAVVWSIAAALMDRMFHPVEWSSDKLTAALFYWAAFILVDVSAGALGMALERRAPWKDLVWIPIQRFGYRQLMYYVVVKAVFTAVRGPRVGWGKLERRATAAVGGPSVRRRKAGGDPSLGQRLAAPSPHAWRRSPASPSGARPRLSGDAPNSIATITSRSIAAHNDPAYNRPRRLDPLGEIRSSRIRPISWTFTSIKPKPSSRPTASRSRADSRRSRWRTPCRRPRTWAARSGW